MAGIPTSNILQPGVISISGGNGVNRALVSQLQLLKPSAYNKYTEKYGNEDYTWWLSTYGGMEKAINQQFFWFENRGKNQIAVTNVNAATPAAGATVTLTLSSADHYNSGTQSPLRIGETVYNAATNVAGVILAINTSTPNAFTFDVRPKIATQSFSVAANGILIFGGIVDAGEASDSNAPQVHLDQQYLNTITEIRDTWTATDLAEMTQVYYDEGFSGSAPTGGNQSGYSLFTLKGLYKANTRYKNSVEWKLMRGDVQNNTGLSGSVGTQGFFPKVQADGETVGYTAGTIDLQKLHEITRVMDVNGCTSQAIWLQDIYQRQAFSDGIFSQFPAGAFVWGQGEKSQEASIAYGFQSIQIDGYMLQTKKYRMLNTEVTTGKTPDVDYFRDYGVIQPQGETRDSKDASKVYKNVTVMYQDPVGGGTVGNGIRVWNWGGGSLNPTSGKMVDNVEQICYRGLRVVAANQFIQVKGA